MITPDQLVERYKARFKDQVSLIQVTERSEGVKKIPRRSVWLTIPRDLLIEAIRELKEIDYPHLTVISAVDTGDAVDLLYHFGIGYGNPHQEMMVTFTVSIPKHDLVIPSITGEIPGAVYSEREKQEMIGVTVSGIPDNRGLFLPDDFPKGVFPWRKDETGIRDDMIKELWKVDRPTDRPAPPVTEAKKKESDPADVCEPEITGNAVDNEVAL